MKKRDFLAGMCCGFFIARFTEFNLSNVSQIITVALVVLAFSSLWEWIKNSTTKITSRNIAMKRLPKYS
jgi:hypothetical protein